MLTYYCSQLSHIETVGSPGLLGSCWTAIKFSMDSSKYIQEGYDRYKPRPFKILTLRGWLVILNRNHLEDIANASVDELSWSEAANDTLKMDYTLGPGIHHDPYIQSLVRSQLSRNLPSLCPDIKDEMVKAFNELLDMKGNEWKTVPAYESVRRMVSRASNRVFVGLPLYAAKESSVMLLTQRIMAINFTAIHTSSNTLTQALYHLAVNPQYAHLLREEVERVVEKDGWTKEALGKMRRVDSFLKETLRYEGVSLLTVERKALKDVKLSDGTFIPKGTVMRVASKCIHHDPGVYDNADVFDPFRFTGLGDDREGSSYQMVTVNSASLPFGYGKLAWYALTLSSLAYQNLSIHSPGRFFAAVELKMMLAHIVLSYDVKVDSNGHQPKNMVFGIAIVADRRAGIMFRKRSEE
ncbi:hypothetical protein ID866_8595 [Astraeus odoratus]|nr:hypothetical protein ID866_8595 [Astraeus odoratus]